jgi:hypothetical protein
MMHVTLISIAETKMNNGDTIGALDAHRRENEVARNLDSAASSVGTKIALMNSHVRLAAAALQGGCIQGAHDSILKAREIYRFLSKDGIQDGIILPGIQNTQPMDVQMRAIETKIDEARLESPQMSC